MVLDKVGAFQMFVACFFILVLKPISCDELIFTHVLWRHGDRTPTRVINNDKLNNESSWPQGLGELTKIGILGEFRLGQLIRTRYVERLKFLDLCNASREIHIRSTDFNRTLMSAFSLLAGLLNNSCYKSYAKDSVVKNWYPFPVHTVPCADDILLGELDCPKADWIFKEKVEKSVEFQKFANDHKDLYNFLSNATGAQVNYTNIGSIFDTLKVIKLHGDEHQMPVWATDKVYQEIYNLSNIGASFEVKNDDVVMFRRGLLLKEIVERFEEKLKIMHSVNASTNDWLKYLRLYAYSAHDSTVMSFLATLGAYKFKRFFIPEYSSCVLVELWKTMEGSLIVKLFYRKGADEEFEEMQILGCPDLPHPCLFSTFVKRSRRFMPTSDWKSECSLYPNLVSRLKGIAFVLCFLLTVCLTAIVVLGVLMIKQLLRVRNKYDGYRRVQLDSMSDKLINGSMLADIDGWDGGASNDGSDDNENQDKL